MKVQPAYPGPSPTLLGALEHFITFELTHLWKSVISAISWQWPGNAISPAPPNSWASHRRP
ncbi:hypothetical protein EMIT051CA3_70105 [Pseudomonas chlororaphis]